MLCFVCDHYLKFIDLHSNQATQTQIYYEKTNMNKESIAFICHFDKIQVLNQLGQQLLKHYSFLLDWSKIYSSYEMACYCHRSDTIKHFLL